MRDDTPTQRYKRQRALGATADLALSVVLSHYGLSHSIVRLLPDGSEKPVDPKWTLFQVEALNFLRELRMSGRIGGPTH
jgi:hypothetical protein